MVGLVGLFLAPALSAACGWVGDVDAGADKFFRPIVFVHGFAGSGEQYEGPAKLFASNGYPPTWITNYDYNSTGPTGGVAPLDKFIDAVRARTGFDKAALKYLFCNFIETADLGADRGRPYRDALENQLSTPRLLRDHCTRLLA